MALDKYHSYYVDDHFVLPPPPPHLDWDWDQLQLHTLGGGGGGDAAQDGIHGAFLPAMLGLESPESSSSEASSGYLQDAVAHWSDRCNKRQRMAKAAPPPRRQAAAVNEDLHCLLQSFWDSSSSGGEGGLMHDLNIMIPVSGSFVSGDEDDASGWEQEQRGPISAAAATSAVQVPAAQGGGGGGGEAAPLFHNHNSSPASSRTTTGQGAAQQLQLQKATSAATAGHAGAAAAGKPGRRGNYSCEEHVFVGKQQQPSPSSRAASASSPRSSSLLTGKEKRDTGVLYPFAVVKPLGLEGGDAATLNDVNQRILKRPARPVRHPVGQFACGPAVYAHGLGLSGKAVVSLTRIRTAGKGTITIIRTRG